MNISNLQQLSGLSFDSQAQQDDVMSKISTIIEFLKQLDMYDVSNTMPLVSPLIGHTHRWSTHTNTNHHNDLLQSVEHQITDRHICVQSTIKE